MIELKFPEDECWSLFDRKVESHKNIIKVIDRTLDKVSEHYNDMPNKIPMKENLSDVSQIIVEEILDIREKIGDNLGAMILFLNNAGDLSNADEDIKQVYNCETYIENLLYRSGKLTQQLVVMSGEL